MKSVKLFVFFLVLMTAISAVGNSSFNRHTFHTSLTRIDYNAKERIFEISIQLFAHDLIPLLEKRNGGKRVELEKSTEADKLILDYLNENFVLSDKSGAAKTLKWVGKESDVDTVMIYLEADSTENLAGYKLKNTLFFANFPEQTNIVVCRYDGVKADLLFKVGDNVKEIIENKTVQDEVK